MKKSFLTICVFASVLFACANEQQKQKTDTSVGKTTKKVSSRKVGMQTLVDMYLKKTGQKITYLKKDVANGYIEFQFEGAPTGIPACQFAYFVTKTDQETLAITIPQCMQACSTSLLFYEIFEGELMENPRKIEGMRDMNEFTALLNKHYETKTNAQEKQMSMAVYDKTTELPQQGTTIKFWKTSLNASKPQLVAEASFDENTGMFKFIKL